MGKFPVPIYDGKRYFLGNFDLVVSFYAQKCQFKCSFCNLPNLSHSEPLSIDKIKKQIDWVFDKYEIYLKDFKQLSIGNEGSILDIARFPIEAMDYLLQKSNENLPNLEVLSLETRPEYIKQNVLKQIIKKSCAKKIDITVGFETQNDYIREVVLNKSIKKEMFEQKMKLLGDLNIRLTSYVMLKPSPDMSEEDGIEEAIETIKYLFDLSKKYSCEVIVYLNPVYVAKGSPLALEFAKKNYNPPKIESVLKVIVKTKKFTNLNIYTGLWSENNAESNGDFTYRKDFKLDIKEAIKKFNKTQNFDILLPFLINQ